MAHQQHRRHRPEQPRPPGPRPIEQLHPVLLFLIHRMGVMPPGNPASLSEAELANAVATAIGLAPDDEQMYLVSRFMSDGEIAQQRLQSPEVQDLRRRIFISGEERRILLRESPEPEDQDDDGGGNDQNDPCLICSERSVLAVPCGCRYCLSCLRTCIRTGLRSELDFPPRCCQPLDEATIRRAGLPALVHLYRQLATEYGVNVALRVYCHDPRCGIFILPQAVEASNFVGACEACGKETCVMCMGRAHRGLPCGEENDEEEMLDMMDANGLAHCPQCGVVMGLSYGCNHMTCVCRAEFCFLCGEMWRTCSCPMYGEHHLRVPVRQRPGRRPIARAGRAHLVEQTEQAPRLPHLRYDESDAIMLENMGDILVQEEVPEWGSEDEDEDEDNLPAFDHDVDDYGNDAGIRLPPLYDHHNRARRVRFVENPVPAREEQRHRHHREALVRVEEDRDRQARRERERERRRREELEPMMVFGTEMRIVDGRLERRRRRGEPDRGRHQDTEMRVAGARRQPEDPLLQLMRFMAGSNDRRHSRR